MRNDFCIFILTHKRADNVITYKTLSDCGYTGEIYLIVDDEDPSLNEYITKYRDKVKVFSKRDYALKFDLGDNFQKTNTVVFARNACFDIAKELGYKYFMQLDDDYKEFAFRLRGNLEYGQWKIRHLDKVFSLIIDFFDKTPVNCICMSQSGDHRGGYLFRFGGGYPASAYNKNLSAMRKIMNTFLCSVERPFVFCSRLNDDVNTYLTNGYRGMLFLTFVNMMVMQARTQSNPGGLTDTYLEHGTYVKSFYSVMFCPSFVKVSNMRLVNARWHHRTNWKAAVPMILRESHRKLSAKPI